ncbi:MAG: hypothetical protein RIQ81_2642 [Pseudomonadota bacterium]
MKHSRAFFPRIFNAQFVACATAIALPAITLPALAGNAVDEAACLDGASDIADKLACLDGVESREQTPTGLPAGVRHFELKFTQPVDHNDTGSPTFTQRVVVLHRDEAEPVVLQTSGYSIFGVREAAITKVFETNQVQVEHRHFKDSVPAPVQWENLDIEQSAKDFHAITVALKKIYRANWVNTGASKGGMTSVFHRWFFPDDVNGTVADVAPLSFSTSDERYISFVEQVGGERWKKCRQALEQLQVALLENREKLVPKMSGDYSFLGGADIAFEHAVIESPFIFWQYGNPEAPGKGCKDIPVKGNPEEQFAFLEAINTLSNYQSGSIAEFLPYFYQAATELGNPGNSTAHLQHLRKHDFTIDQYTPRDVRYAYSNAAMRDLERWIKEEAQSIMFVYGELDPWTAGAFPAGRSDRDNMTLMVPGGNHGAKFTLLANGDRRRAETTIGRWLGKQAVPARAKSELIGTLDELEFRIRKRN